MHNTNIFHSLIQGCKLQILLLFIFSTYVAQGSSEFKDAKQQQQRQRFESLLAAGRSLSFPFSIGFILTIASNDKHNWNVSENGIQEAVGLSQETLLTSYSSLLKDLKEDDNVTMSSIIYAMREGWNKTSYLDQLDTTVKTVVWNETKSNETWDLMNNHLAEVTNGLMDGKLIPRDSALGTPFPFSTQSAIVSTFHYHNYWKYPWTDGGLERFYDSGKVPFLKVQGEFLVSDTDEFTAVDIPLEGGKKSLVLVLPNINITRFTSRDQGDDEADEVPFPKIWTTKTLSILLPSFNLTWADQYGKELEELGMNSTFCTTLHDRRGRLPFYMRPIAQINDIKLSEESLEIASATGTAIEKFYLGLDVGGKGYPKKSRYDIDTNPGDSTSTEAPNNTPSMISQVGLNPQQQQQLIFNRPFLFYLNDTKAGPMFYGIVSKINAVVTNNGTEANKDESIISGKAEAEKFILWSCRSFKQSGDINENPDETF